MQPIRIMFHRRFTFSVLQAADGATHDDVACDPGVRREVDRLIRRGFLDGVVRVHVGYGDAPVAAMFHVADGRVRHASTIAQSH